MTRQTGVVITIVVAVLTLCCSVTSCAGGAMMAASEWMGLEGFDVEWYLGFPFVCLGILVWALPLLLWFLLVRGREGTAQ